MKIYINNTEILNERRRGLRPATALFYYLKDRINVYGEVDIPKEELARALKVCPKTIKNWLYALRSADVLKYKYSGRIQLNPDVYFSGESDQRNNALNLYKAFKSDI